jgi:ribosomal protein L14
MRRPLGSIYWVSDNTGVISCKLISILNRKYPTIGDFLLVAIKNKLKLKKTIKKKILYAVLMQNKNKVYRQAGDYYFCFAKRSILLLNNEKDNFLGTKIFAPLTLELFKKAQNPLEPVFRYFKSVI